MNRRQASFAVLMGLLISALSGEGEVQAVQTVIVDTAQITFTSPTQSDFDAGQLEQLSANTLTIESDVDWKLTVAGTSSTWSCSGAKCWTAKPRSDIRWRETGSQYETLTGSATVVKTGAATSPGSEDVVVDYQVLLDWTEDSPGTYNYDYVQYEVTAL